MPPLLKIRSERDQMSAIERRIADFILENAHLLRDYSSLQLASALRISQSSVVKFSQKLGFKGYPDLKFSVGEALARTGAVADAKPATGDDFSVLVDTLRQRKYDADEETLLINSRDALDQVAGVLDTAGKVFVCGLGEDGLYARKFALKLSSLGILALHHAATPS